MRRHVPTQLAAALVAASFPIAAQQPSPPPAFAASNLSESGIRAMAANCAACHGTNGRAAPEAPVAALAGRPSEEIVRMMEQFRSGARPATLMHQIAKGYSDAEIAALAGYFSKQPREVSR